jgi:hypothetical protein
MTESLRALLGGAIDYAGMFPPAGLPLEQALVKYRQHRAGPEAWMVGRFVCPAGLLPILVTMYSAGHDGRVSVIATAHEATDFTTTVADALTAVRDFPIVDVIDTVEFRWPRGLVESVDSGLLDTVMKVAAHEVVRLKLPRLTLFFEFPRIEGGCAAWQFQRMISDAMHVLADYNEFATYSSAGFKVRCGGAGAGAIPSRSEAAAVISTCRDTGVFWKATAGLHHPFRHVDPALGVPVHGFINLLTAAVMANVHRLDADRVQIILEDDDPWHFRFTNEALTWRDLSATAPQITAARERGLRSFGSCSIDEPWHDLTVLGLL